jgi:squalene-associated FAD-dependent desaturase
MNSEHRPLASCTELIEEARPELVEVASQSEPKKPVTLPRAELEPAAAKNISHASKSVAIIGGGLAGMAAAAMAIRQGLQVDLFEQSNRLGGRVGSFEEPFNGQTIDQCQHLALGCCTSFIDFCRRAGVEDCFKRYKTLHFLGPDGSQSDLTAWRWLPPPLHLLPGLLRLKYLTWRECWSIARTLGRLIRLRITDQNNSETIGTWLRQQGQSQSVIDKFWSTILVSALSETVDHASLAVAKKVFLDGFCASRRAYELLIPCVPLGEIFDRRAGAWLEEQGVRIHRSARVREIASPDAYGLAVFLQDGTVQNFPAVIVAVPWFELPFLFSASPVNFPLQLDALKQIPIGTITAVHLWFDRAITALPHATLVGRLSQWLFNGAILMSELASDRHGHNTQNEKSYYYQIVISAAHRVIKQDNKNLLQRVLNDLAAVFPDTRQAKLLHRRVVTMPRAVFSLQPGVDRVRPLQKTAVPNLFFAGDWTATGWPATMESAVRSGHLAVERLLESL